MSFSTQIRNLADYLANIKEICMNELHAYPKGSLSITKNRKYWSYYQLDDKDSNYAKHAIGTKPDLIHKFARKAYLNEYIKRLDYCISKLDDVNSAFECLSFNKVLQALPKHFDILPVDYLLTSARTSIESNTKWHPNPRYDSVDPVRISTYLNQNQKPNAMALGDATNVMDSRNPSEWFVRPYLQNAYKTDNKIHRASCGMNVRSKSEVAILERYEHFGILWHYDEVIVDDNGERKSPDIIGMRDDGKVIFHEHFGMMNDSKYRNEYKSKLAYYEKNGIVPWDNLIITFDRPDGSINVSLIDEQLKEFYRL